jgi:hypothetical protein
MEKKTNREIKQQGAAFSVSIFQYWTNVLVLTGTIVFGGNRAFKRRGSA